MYTKFHLYKAAKAQQGLQLVLQKNKLENIARLSLLMKKDARRIEKQTFETLIDDEEVKFKRVKRVKKEEKRRKGEIEKKKEDDIVLLKVVNTNRLGEINLHPSVHLDRCPTPTTLAVQRQV